MKGKPAFGVVVVGALFWASGSLLPASATGAVDRIMFASDRGGTFDLYSMNEDGTDTRLVVDGPMDEMHPDISPDGERIAFVRSVGVDRPQPNGSGGCCGPSVDLFVANIDGSGITPLMPHPVIDDYRPDWSPDGTRIAFSRGNLAVAVSNIFTVKPDGSELEQVTDGILGNNVASWSPNGTQLVFVSTRAGTPLAPGLWITDAKGENQHALTAAPPGVFHTSPQWAPTGDLIVFGSTQDGGASELYTIRPDGSELTRLTTNTVSDSYATWSPDGTRIAWSGNGAIWVMNADGSDQRQISDGLSDTFPVYHPRVPRRDAPHGRQVR
jgi:Tol biopolymer transport system component